MSPFKFDASSGYYVYVFMVYGSGNPGFMDWHHVLNASGVVRLEFL